MFSMPTQTLLSLLFPLFLKSNRKICVEKSFFGQKFRAPPPNYFELLRPFLDYSQQCTIKKCKSYVKDLLTINQIWLLTLASFFSMFLLICKLRFPANHAGEEQKNVFAKCSLHFPPNEEKDH